MTTIREQWNALLGRLGLAPDTEYGVSDKQLETLNEALTEQAERTDPPAGETNAGQTVTATRTLPHEDPSPTETPRSANQAAYDSDLRNFRR